MHYPPVGDLPNPCVVRCVYTARVHTTTGSVRNCGCLRTFQGAVRCVDPAHVHTTTGSLNTCPQKALRGVIPCPLLEPSARSWNHFVTNCCQKLTNLIKNDFEITPRRALRGGAFAPFKVQSAVWTPHVFVQREARPPGAPKGVSGPSLTPDDNEGCYQFQSEPSTVHPTPYTLHPTHYNPHPTPYTLHPTPSYHAKSAFSWIGRRPRCC